MELGLRSKRVLITGSTQGIGKAVAESMLNEGAEVLLNGRNQQKLESTVCELQKKYTKAVILGFAGDMANTEDLNKLSEFIAEKWKKIDILIPNVGRGKAFSNNKLDKTEWDELLSVNLKSAVQTINVLKELLNEGGSIVTVSSIAAREVIGAPIAYAAAKEGIAVLTKYLSRYLADRKIRVNCVMPGNIFFQGGRWEEILQEDHQKTEAYIETEVPLKRFGHPEEIADSVVFLASEKSSFTTGSILVIDGGQTRAIG